jgi:MEMO1 family protein
MLKKQKLQSTKRNDAASEALLKFQLTNLIMDWKILEIFLAVAIIAIAASFFTMPEEKQENKIIQRAAVAGQWYPNDEVMLNAIVTSYLNGSGKSISGSVKAVIVPHAGYEYSGKVAAAAFRQVGSYENVFLLGPSHYYPLEGMAVLNATHYETPLGLMKISEVENKLLAEGASINKDAFSKEHSLEAEIPFLQTVTPKSELVPILIGQIDSEKLKNVLEKYLGGNDLIVVSADLSHFHNDSSARELDKYSIDSIMQLDENKIMQAEIDASFAVAALLQLAKERGWQPVLLNYSNSGEVTGDKSSVVGYAAIVFTEQEISKKDQAFLLNLSRNVLESFVTGGNIPAIDESLISSQMKEVKGCFVTLTKNGELRGCIGHITPQEQMYKCIIDNTINAASRDSRFSRVESNELADIKIEISALTSPEKIDLHGNDLVNVLTEKDGVVLRQIFNEATYLPQVWDIIPNRIQFLESLCEKGGMAKDCWNSTQTEVYIYRDFAFSEGSR